MEERPGAKSILEYLTAKNPCIEYPPPESKTVSSNRKYHWPTQLKSWTEFTFPTLEAVYQRSLLEEARRKSRGLLHYPSYLDGVENVVEDEPTTTHFLTTWNYRIVLKALTLPTVWNSFHPSVWRSKATPHASETSAKKTARLKGDAGAVALCKTCRCSPPDPSLATERFPKEYKTASKWQSSDVTRGPFIDGSGLWKPGFNRVRMNMPIAQAYTASVNLGCRYGCILTTGEAFIFRIMPRPQRSEPDAGNDNGRSSSPSKEELKRMLQNDGLMEYVSIPWENHWDGAPNQAVPLTVNLALWFVHILAGNAYEIEQTYDALEKERLIAGRCGAISPLEVSEHHDDGEEPHLSQRRYYLRSRSSTANLNSKKRRQDSSASHATNPPFRSSFDQSFCSVATQSSDRQMEEGALSFSQNSQWAGRSFSEMSSASTRASKRRRSGERSSGAC